jgi:hypothetical protein
LHKHRRSIWPDLDRALSGDDAKVAEIQREHLAAVALSAGNDGGVSKAQGEINVATDELADAGQILLATVEGIGVRFEIGEEQVQRVKTEPLLDHVRHFGQDAGWHQVRPVIPQQTGSSALMIRVATVEESQETRGVKGDQQRPQ